MYQGMKTIPGCEKEGLFVFLYYYHYYLLLARQSGALRRGASRGSPGRYGIFLLNEYFVE